MFLICSFLYTFANLQLMEELNMGGLNPEADYGTSIQDQNCSASFFF